MLWPNDTAYTSECFNPLYTGHKLAGSSQVRDSLVAFQSPIHGSQAVSPSPCRSTSLCFNPLYTGHKRGNIISTRTGCPVSIPYTGHNMELNKYFLKCCFNPIHGSCQKTKTCGLYRFQSPYTGHKLNRKSQKLFKISFNPLYTSQQVRCPCVACFFMFQSPIHGSQATVFETK